jgi:hypothetical protein
MNITVPQDILSQLVYNSMIFKPDRERCELYTQACNIDRKHGLYDGLVANYRHYCECANLWYDREFLEKPLPLTEKYELPDFPGMAVFRKHSLKNH